MRKNGSLKMKGYGYRVAEGHGKGRLWRGWDTHWAGLKLLY